MCRYGADEAYRTISLEADIDIVCGDIKEAAEIFGAASFHAVTSNPPYMIGQHGLQNPYMAKAIARHEILCTLEDVVSQAAAVLKGQRTFLYGTPTVPSGRNFSGAHEI